MVFMWDDMDRERDWRSRDNAPPPPPPTPDFGVGPDVGPDVPPDVPDIPDFGSFEFPSYGGPSAPTVGPAPTFRPPQFEAPTLEQAMAEPGYQFRLQSGQQALDRSAAARGVLRTGTTLQDQVEFGQNFGAQEYSNMFNRALAAYGAQYQAAYDAFRPELMRYQAQIGADQSAFDRAYDLYALQSQLAWERERLLAELAMRDGPAPPDASY